MQPRLVQTSPHFCQVRFDERSFADKYPDIAPEGDLRAYLFFDDLWVAANPDLAESLLRYGSGWDCLEESPR